MNVSNFLEDSMNNEELQKISNFHRQDLHYKSWVNIPENIKIISVFWNIHKTSQTQTFYN